MKRFTAQLIDPLVALQFRYDGKLIDFIKQLPGATYDVIRRGYLMPPHSFSLLVDMYGVDEFDLGPGVTDQLHPDQTIGYTNPTWVDPAFAPYAPTWAMRNGNDGLTSTDHQATGSSWIIHTPRGFLLDDMGLGKSKQWIDAVSHAAFQNYNGVTRALVGCRASNIDTWANEIAKFAPTAIINKFRGAKRHLTRIPSGPLEFVLASYESLRKYSTIFATYSWDWICLDEGHAIKSNPLNKQSEIARLIHMLDAPRKLIMTGTAMPNDPSEIYNQLVWLGLENRTWQQFEDDTLVVVNMGKQETYREAPRRKIVGYKPIGLRNLRTKIAANVVRRLKDEVLNLPPKIRQTEFVTLTPIEHRLYTGAANELKLYVSEHPDADYTTIHQSAQMVRLKQMTSNASVFAERPFISSKLKRAMEIIADVTQNGSKVIVFSQFRSVIADLAEHLADYDPAVITGDVSTGAGKSGTSPRQAQVDKFQESPSCKVFLGTSAACRYGFTLTAASYEIFIDLDWNEAYNEQNEDRAYRIGQTNTLNVIRLQAELSDGTKTFDSDIEQLNIRKHRLSESMLRKAQ